MVYLAMTDGGRPTHDLEAIKAVEFKLLSFKER
jgi:hypothetical protein